MYYRAKKLSKTAMKRIMRHKRVRYHNDAALFPDDNLLTDRKRRASLKNNNLKDVQSP